MRCVLSLVVLCTCLFAAISAPISVVKISKTTWNKEYEKLSSSDPEVVFVSAMKLLDTSKETVEYLREKLFVEPPSIKDVEEAISNFQVADEKKQTLGREAIEAWTGYPHVSRRILAATQLNGDASSKRRLIRLAFAHWPRSKKDLSNDTFVVTFSPRAEGDKNNVQWTSNNAIGTLSVDLPNDEDFVVGPSTDIIKARRGIMILQRLQTPAAEKLLSDLSKGREELPTTKVAIEALKQRESK